MANARSRGNIPLTDVDKHCDREQGPTPWTMRRSIERNRARNLGEGGQGHTVSLVCVPTYCFFQVSSRCRAGTEPPRPMVALSSTSAWKSVTMDMRAKRRWRFSSRAASSPRHVRSSRCSRYRVTRVKYARQDEKDDEDATRKREARHEEVGRRVIATSCHLDGDGRSART